MDAAAEALENFRVWAGSEFQFRIECVGQLLPSEQPLPLFRIIYATITSMIAGLPLQPRFGSRSWGRTKLSHGKFRIFVPKSSIF